MNQYMDIARATIDSLKATLGLGLLRLLRPYSAQAGAMLTAKELAVRTPDEPFQLDARQAMLQLQAHNFIIGVRRTRKSGFSDVRQLFSLPDLPRSNTRSVKPQRPHISLQAVSGSIRNQREYLKTNRAELFRRLIGLDPK